VQQGGIEASAVGGHLAVLPEDEALGAWIDAGGGEVADLGHELAAQGEDGVAQRDRAFVGESGLAARGNRQGPELRLEPGDGTHFLARVVEGGPETFEVTRAEA
jgi:hypothetical protein